MAAMLADLPRACDVGAKRNAKGYQETWTGYKLHIDTADGEIPISCVLTAASVHDSQACPCEGGGRHPACHHNSRAGYQSL